MYSKIYTLSSWRVCQSRFQTSAPCSDLVQLFLTQELCSLYNAEGSDLCDDACRPVLHSAPQSDRAKGGQLFDGDHPGLAWPAIPAAGAVGSAAYLVGVFGPTFIELVLARPCSGKSGSADA